MAYPSRKRKLSRASKSDGEKSPSRNVGSSSPRTRSRTESSSATGSLPAPRGPADDNTPRGDAATECTVSDASSATPKARANSGDANAHSELPSAQDPESKFDASGPGPTIAGPIIEIMRKQEEGFVVAEAVTSLSTGLPNRNGAPSDPSKDGMPAPTAPSGKQSSDLSLSGFDSHMHNTSGSHAGHGQGQDTVIDTFIGTAVGALLGSRPRSMSQESVGSLGLRSRSNTLDMLGVAADIHPGGRRSRSNTLDFLNGIPLGEGSIGSGSMRSDTLPTVKIGKPRSGSHGSHSSHRSGMSNLSARRDEIKSAMDHLDALGETKSSASLAAGAKKVGLEGNNGNLRKNSRASEQSRESARTQGSGSTLDATNQKLLYEALLGGGGARDRPDSEHPAWSSILSSSNPRDRADSWGGLSDISFSANHADIVAQYTAIHRSGLADDVAAAAADIDDDVMVGREALLYISSPAASCHASEASVSTETGKGGKKVVQKSKAASSVPKKIAVKGKSAVSKSSGKANIKGLAQKRSDSVSSASAKPMTQTLSVYFPKNMPHGAAAAAARAAAEAATAAGASQSELSAIVAAAMGTVSKQLFNIAGDVEKVLSEGKKKFGAKKVTIEYTARPPTKAPAKTAQISRPAARDSISKAVKKEESAFGESSKGPKPDLAARGVSQQNNSLASAQKFEDGLVADAAASGKASGPPAAAMAKHHKLPNNKLPLRKRTDSGSGIVDLPMVDLPAPLPDASSVTKPSGPPGSKSTPAISVDYDAVAAAVAATAGTLPSDIAAMKARKSVAVGNAAVDGSDLQMHEVVAPASGGTGLGKQTGHPSMNEPTAMAIQLTPKHQPPLKKRTKRPSPHPGIEASAQGPLPPSHQPLQASSILPPSETKPNASRSLFAPTTPAARAVATTPSTCYSMGSHVSYNTPGSAAIFSSSNTQSNQKWDEMFDCLVMYVKNQKQKHAGTMKGGKEWKWDGNVPTTYKTKDSKALGRWINNQRSAKTKGSLKPEREERLLSTGLKWSVLSTNAWPDMLKELKRYVKEKQESGEDWDGNVPTNYRIRTKGEGGDYDEEKNLGRWINRQRSLYQAGKLKKERQEELEQIGLRWSVLSTTSWDTMFDSLLKYAQARRDENPPEMGWDGNVPANYKTAENPPKSLGRWVNRQRSAYAKNKLKQEFVEKLEVAGLKWSVHERKDRIRSPYTLSSPSPPPTV